MTKAAMVDASHLKVARVGQDKKFSPFEVFGTGYPKTPQIIEGFDTQHPITTGFIPNPDHFFGADFARELLASFVLKKPALLVGEPGCGKTSGAIEFLMRLNYPFMKIDGSKFHDRSSLFGRLVPRKEGGLAWVDGPITICARNGWACVFDEMFKTSDEALVTLNALVEGRPVLLEENDNEVVVPAAGFWLIGTSNGAGNGADRLRFSTEKKQDGSLRNRLSFIKCSYLSKEAEIEVLRKKYPKLNKEIIELFVTFARDTRAASAMQDSEKRIEEPMSTRELIAALDYFVVLNRTESALNMAYFNKLSDIDATAARALLSSLTVGETTSQAGAASA